MPQQSDPLDRLTPYDLPAERATLGAILLERDAVVVVATFLEPTHFYLEKHALIYEAMLACYQRRVPPDLNTVAAELRQREQLDLVGGVSFLGELTGEVPTAVHVEYYARVVEQAAVSRALIERPAARSLPSATTTAGQLRSVSTRQRSASTSSRRSASLARILSP